MKRAYPIIMTKGTKKIVVFIPDFEINTQGKDYTEAIEMARDAIGLMGIDMQDEGEKLPSATDINIIQENLTSKELASLVDVDFDDLSKKLPQVSLGQFNLAIYIREIRCFYVLHTHEAAHANAYALELLPRDCGLDLS